MSQLIKIILIDSLCAGAKAELVMRGNTSVNGTNGIGKSSFLKLIPVFYGAAPGRLVKAGANRHSFANWYLPNSSSFIIFEYTNYDNATRCVIMHRSGEGYAYRLVAQAWQPELLYRDCAAGLLVPSGELIGHLARMGMDCSPELQPLHYRKIIQYNTGSAHLDDVDDASKRPLIMGLRLKFSLAPRRKHFAGIDNVTLALLESGGTFDTMKVTMAEILQQENADPGRALMTLNARPFRQVLDNRASFLLMEQMQPGILHLDQLRHGFAAVTRQLGVQKWRALQLMRTLEAQQETRSAVLAALAEEEQALERTSGDRRRELATRLGKVQAELAQASQQVSSIEEQCQDYASSGIAEWLERASRHAETLLQREQKQVHLNQLNQQGLDIRQVYDQRAQTAKDTATSQREMTRVQLEGVRQAIQNRLDAQGDALNQLLEKTGDAQYVELETQQQRLHDLISQCIREDAALDHLKTMKVLPQAQAELDQAQLGINNQQILCRKLQDALAGLEDESQKLRQEQEALVADFQGVDRERAALQRQREVLKAQASAGADTLLGFLKRHHPNWTEHIARLVPADILMRTDLNPEFFTEAQQSLYGVELSLGALPLPAFACKEMGEAEIAALTEQIHELDGVLEGMQKQRRSLEEKMRQHNGKLIQARNVLSQADTELASRISLREGILSRALAAHAEQVALQKHRVEDASAHKRHMESRMAGLKKTHADHVLLLRDSGERARQAILEERLQQQERAQVVLARIALDLAAELQRIDADKAARLQDAGIDDQESRRLKRELDELDERIKAVNDRRSEIERYQHWVAKILPDLPRLSGIKNGLQGDQDRLAREAQSQEREVEQSSAHIRVRRQALTERERLDGEQQRVLQNIFGRLSFLDDIDEEAWSASLTAADIEDEANQLLRQRTELDKQGRAHYISIHSRFHQESLLHTPQGAAIEQIVNQARNAAYGTETAWIEGAAGLLEYIEVSHPDQKIKLIVQARNLSDELCDSRGKLETLHKSIQRLGRDATAKAGEVLGAFAQIRQFEFRVTSRIHSLTFWEDLSRYEQQYRRWMMMGEGYLPTEGFIEALRRVERQIAEGAFTSKFSDCFDVSVSCNDQGRTKVATNNAELIGISSTGVTKIIVSMIYVSLFELLRQDADFQMSVPIDEALELSAENYVALVDYFNSRGIAMLAGFPGGAPELLRQFPNRYTLERRLDADAIIVKEYGIDDGDVLDDLNAALGMDEAEFVL